MKNKASLKINFVPEQVYLSNHVKLEQKCEIIFQNK